MKVTVPVVIGKYDNEIKELGKRIGKKPISLNLEIDVIIVEIIGKPVGEESMHIGSASNTTPHYVFGGKIEIVYDVYMNKRRIGNGLWLSRKYDSHNDYSQALEELRKLLHKPLLSGNSVVSKVLNN